MKDLPKEERPRERLILKGPKALSNTELLCLILGTGSKKYNVIELSKRLLQENNIKDLSMRGVNFLKSHFGIGKAKACQIIACFELGRRLSVFQEKQKNRINNAQDIANLLFAEMSYLKKEHFKGVFLDSRKRIIKEKTIFIGTLNASIVHPRDIFRAALEESAAAIILVHNHPSGDPCPSEEDIQITNDLRKAGRLLGIEVLDHIIIGNRNFFSLRENNYF